MSVKAKFIDGFEKQAKKNGMISKILYRLSRGLSVKMKGQSSKSAIRRTRTGKEIR